MELTTAEHGTLTEATRTRVHKINMVVNGQSSYDRSKMALCKIFFQELKYTVIEPGILDDYLGLL